MATSSVTPDPAVIVVEVNNYLKKRDAAVDINDIISDIQRHRYHTPSQIRTAVSELIEAGRIKLDARLPIPERTCDKCHLFQPFPPAQKEHYQATTGTEADGLCHFLPQYHDSHGTILVRAKHGCPAFGLPETDTLQGEW